MIDRRGFLGLAAAVIVALVVASGFSHASAQAREDSLLARRHRMVEDQIKARDIKDERVLAAMLKVPRERFVPSEAAPQAYADRALPIGYGQTISQPYIVAYMTEGLQLTNIK